MSIGIFGGIVSFAVLRVMTMLYLARHPREDYRSQPGYDMGSDLEHGPNRVQYVFDARMTAYWARNNGWLVLGVMRAGLVLSLLTVVAGLILLATGT